MSVTVDHAPLKTDELGLRTVGQVLAHLQRENRLIVHVLIDGEEPDLQKLPTVRQSPLRGHTVFIETADPRQMARDIIAEVDSQLDQAERLKAEAAGLLRKSQWAPAMEKLSGCFSLWQHAQEAIVGTAQLLKLDVEQVLVEGQPLAELMGQFTDQLRQIKSALESRDFVALTDLLAYETQETSSRWHAALMALEQLIG
jgi:hypothetical protein